MDYGLVEIGNIATKAPTDAIRTLKSILDQHHIYHIFDGVAFFHPHAEPARSRAIHRGRVGKVDTTEDRFRRRKIHPIDRSKYRELIVPDLYELDYMSLIILDSEEVDFLAAIVYEGDRKDRQIAKKTDQHMAQNVP
jgi:hypothetical protein